MSREQIFYGKRLKAIRESANLSQKELANILGIAQQTYNHYEVQENIIPLKHLNFLANYYNVSIDYILGLSETSHISKEEIDAITCGKRLKEFRKENNLTQEKVAKFLNIDQPTWSIYEKGKSLIGTPFLYAICNKYNISADYLLGRIDKNTLKSDKN